MRALAVGAPVAAVAGGACRWVTGLVTEAWACVLLAVIGALVTAAVVLLAVHLADRRLLRVLRRPARAGAHSGLEDDAAPPGRGAAHRTPPGPPAGGTPSDREERP